MSRKQKTYEYEVIVGNVGSVYYGKDKAKAEKAYAEYVEQSNRLLGRAGGEEVTMMVDGEPEKEHVPNIQLKFLITCPLHLPYSSDDFTEAHRQIKEAIQIVVSQIPGATMVCQVT